MAPRGAPPKTESASYRSGGSKIETISYRLRRVSSRLWGGMATAGPLKVKVILLGVEKVGKTSIIQRFVDNKFNDKHLSTLQVSRSSGSQRVCGTLRVRWTRHPGATF